MRRITSTTRVLAVAYYDRDADGSITAWDLDELASRPRLSGDSRWSAGAATAEESETRWSIMEDFVTEVLQRLELDPEDPGFYELPEIDNEDLVLMATEQATELFSYENLAALTVEYIAWPDVATPLCAKLAAAEAAEELGNLEARNNILNAYRRQLSAEVGKSLTTEQAAILETLSRTLQSATE